VKAPGPSKQLEKVYVFGVNNPPQMNDDDDDYGPTPVKAEGLCTFLNDRVRILILS
jgi:hypothetical protein